MARVGVILGTGRLLVRFPVGDMQEAERGASAEDTHHVWPSRVAVGGLQGRWQTQPAR